MIDAEALQIATARILLDSLTPGDREKLLTDAMQSIITPAKPKNSWEKPGNTILQDAFENAVNRAANQAVDEYFKTPEVKARVAEFVSAAVEKSLADADGFISKLSSRMLNGIWRE